MNRPCGREEMCEPCTGIEYDYQGRKDVCVAVGKVAIRSDSDTLSEEAIRDLTYDELAAAIDDDDYVSPEMRNAAFNSTNQLIHERRVGL